ncbi:MAG TPA: methyltransferase domain-containing protein [Candidatus Kapabacteria bacterium]|nr:methyltransferase domain-containing protein [Candidatus Kapabacteria bacterium]
MTEKHAYDFDLRLDDPVSTHALQFRMIPAGARVLDIGCHTGILGAALRERKQCIVTGIDNDSEALRAAAGRLDAVLPVDLEQPGWARRVLDAGMKDFDILIFGDVIEHTRNPLAIIREAGALLGTEGKIIVSVPNVANLRVRLGLLRGRFDYTESGILDKTHLRFFTLRSARELMAQASYRIVHEAYSGYSMPRRLIDLAPSFFAVNIIMMGQPLSKA